MMLKVNPYGVKTNQAVVEHFLESITGDLSTQIEREIPEHPKRNLVKVVSNSEITQAVKAKFMPTKAENAAKKA